MDIIKRLFTFNNDDDCAIGLCKFNDSFYKEINLNSIISPVYIKENTMNSDLANRSPKDLLLPALDVKEISNLWEIR